jgi:hypothetical protein
MGKRRRSANCRSRFFHAPKTPQDYWKLRSLASSSGQSRSSFASGPARFRLDPFALPRALRARRVDRIEEPSSRRRDIGYSLLEGLVVRGLGPVEPADLAHKLQGCIMYFSFRGRWLKVGENANVAAHLDRKDSRAWLSSPAP